MASCRTQNKCAQGLSQILAGKEEGVSRHPQKELQTPADCHHCCPGSPPAGVDLAHCLVGDHGHKSQIPDLSLNSQWGYRTAHIPG